MTNNDLSGEAAPVDARFVTYFSDLTTDSKKLEHLEKKLKDEINSTIEHIQVACATEINAFNHAANNLHKITSPLLKEMNKKLAPVLSKLRREEIRLKLDLEEGWEKLFMFHEEYQGRAMAFDSKTKTFKFHPQGKVMSQKLLTEISEQLKQVLPYAEFELHIEDEIDENEKEEGFCP